MGRLRSVRPALDNLLAAHVLAYAALHRLHRDRGWPDPIMTSNTYTNSVYELDRGLVDVLPDAVPRPWKDPPRPRSFRAFVRAATDHGLPVWILENGLCNRVKDGVSFPRGDGWTRTRYLQEHVPLVAELTASGAPVELYVHWSLYDNYEWGSYEPRFGIHGIDRIGARPQRMAVDSMGGDSAATYAGLVRDLRDG
jgi:hypothetical protein